MLSHPNTLPDEMLTHFAMSSEHGSKAEELERGQCRQRTASRLVLQQVRGLGEEEVPIVGLGRPGESVA